jgi:hypothetical protein
MPDAAARMKVLEDHNFKNVPDDFKLKDMYEYELRMIGDIRQ